MPEIEFRKAIIPEEIPALLEFDRLAFSDNLSDLFSTEEWRQYESYWMILNGRIIGCTALETGSTQLWIASTAILCEFRQQGFGKKIKEWQIEYARAHCFKSIGTVTRQSNEAMIRLNEKFGFKQTRTEPHRYSDPDEAGIVMELVLP